MRLALAIAVGLAIWGLTTCILFIVGTRTAFSVSKAIGRNAIYGGLVESWVTGFLIAVVLGLCAYFLKAERLLLGTIPFSVWRMSVIGKIL